MRSLSLEDPLEKEVATHSSFSPGRFYGQKNLVGCSLWGCRESDTAEHTHTHTRSMLWGRGSVLKVVQAAREDA